MTRTLASLTFGLICASQIAATDCGQILTDPGFDLWCGDRLCHWKLERGEIAQVPSWHAGDDAVALIGPDVALSQDTAVNANDTDCIRFDMIADVDETAEVHLEADVFGDGTVDWVERIPTSAWDPVSLRIGIAGWYDGVVFRLTKTGPGDATLAQIAAEVVEPEDGGCPSHVGPIARPLGAVCSDSIDCGDAVCVDNVCSACRDTADCASGEVCGRVYGPGRLFDWTACEPAGADELGDPCYGDGECASGACGGDVCVECNAGVACDGGAACVEVQAAGDTELSVTACAGAPRASGEPCAADAMCASGACQGAPVGTCDGIPAWECYGDDDCPGFAGPNPCTFVAVAGGTCQ